MLQDVIMHDGMDTVAGMDLIVTVTDAPSPEARALIGDGLNGHNRDQAGCLVSLSHHLATSPRPVPVPY
jgi:hypothetical protein